MRELIALRPVLYHAHQYSTGESLPVNDQEMTELWLKAGTAMWKEDEPEPQAAQAIPVTAVAGMPGMSDAGTDGLIGRIPETPERKPLLRRNRQEPQRERRKHDLQRHHKEGCAADFFERG